MQTREEVIAFCKTFPGAYEDYPFDDFNWTVMRRGDTKRGFAWIYEKDGTLWANLKAEPEWAEFLRKGCPYVLPAYHMNKKHWNSVPVKDAPEEELKQMIADSYRLCGKK